MCLRPEYNLSVVVPNRNGFKNKKGDKIICQKNTPEIKNGEIGIVMSMTSDDNKNSNLL